MERIEIAMEITTEANAQEIALLVRELVARAKSKASAMGGKVRARFCLD